MMVTRRLSLDLLLPIRVEDATIKRYKLTRTEDIASN